MTKKKIVINTDYPLLKTGLARNGKELALHLYKTGKYEIIYYACGVPWDSIEYNRFPFKMVGALPNDPSEMDRIQRDPQQARDASYGAYNIDRVIKEFKPDILIMSNDSWASFPFISRPWWNKIHCIPHITLDSLPFLPDQKKYIESSKKFYVWADFAKTEAERLNYKNVEVISGIINPKHFFKLTKQEKQNNRKKFNIPEDAFITGFVFRSQIRKETPQLIEGYSIFKKQNPEIKNTYLLLHTNFSEGWNIPLLCEEHGVNKNEILTTYICRNCKEIQVKAFTGQDLHCSCCESQDSQITCNVQYGCTEEELNVVYNLMDLYLHCANAAGLEMPCCEALYAEVPLATMAYASCEMFTDQPFVTSIDFAWSVQHGTQFKRATPYASAIAKAIKKFATTPQLEREKLGKQGRAWALSKFSPDVVCKQWEDVIDSLPDHGWDYNTAPILKDPHAQIPNIPDDKMWVKELYNKILRVEPDENGWNYWLNLLRNNTSRDQIMNQFRQIAEADNQKVGGTKQISFEEQLDKTGRKRFLIVAKESIGDLLYVTSLLDSFKESYPDYDLYLACDPQYSEIFDGNKHLHKVLAYQPFMESEIACTGQGENKGLFDGYCHLTIGTQRHLNYLTNSRIALQLTEK